MKYRIETLAMREITTRRGISQVYDLSLSDGRSYDAFVSDWNCAWQKGEEIDLEPAQIQKREKGGRVYLTIHPPAENKNGAGPKAERAGETIRLDAGGLLAAVLDDSHELEIVIVVRRRKSPPSESR